MSAEITAPSAFAAWGERLQWGRAQMSAEITAGRKSGGVKGSASMGPRSNERGNKEQYLLLVPFDLSFNGAALK